jgi:hypothetical protein
MTREAQSKLYKGEVGRGWKCTEATAEKVFQKYELA